MKRLLAPALAAGLLAACAPGLSVPDGMDVPTGHRTDVAGLPYVAGAFSAGIQISDTHLLTVAHSNWPSTMEVSQRFDARLVRVTGDPSPVGPRPLVGDLVTLFGSGPHGQPRYARGIVAFARMWACHGALVPNIHTTPGVCTRSGRGYIYGFGVIAEIGPGFSGGGVYDDRNRVVGMIQSVGLGPATDGTAGVVFVQHMDDLIAEFGLEAYVQ